jgi:queuine tRNA-ribosyltransferase
MVDAQAARAMHGGLQQGCNRRMRLVCQCIGSPGRQPPGLALRADRVGWRADLEAAIDQVLLRPGVGADRIGADISMQLDQCVSWPAEEPAARAAMELSVRWGARSKAAFGTRETQALFGIQQGSTFENLRRESSDRLQEIGFDGYAIGGLAVGEGHQAMCEVLDYAPDMLPVDRPRYLMGVGKPVDLVEAVWRGVDMFDCVLPTRAGRHGQAWTWAGPINLKNARFAEDQDPLEPDIPCPASQAYSKAYLHHLIRADEILGKVLLSWHNIAFFQALTAAMRDAIAHGRFEAFRRDFHARHTSNG